MARGFGVSVYTKTVHAINDPKGLFVLLIGYEMDLGHAKGRLLVII